MQELCIFFFYKDLELAQMTMPRIMTHPKVISNLCVKLKLSMFLNKKEDTERTNEIFFFPEPDHQNKTDDSCLDRSDDLLLTTRCDPTLRIKSLL